jgi:hypothetical protein
MNNETYNGWANYETWRINLELIDHDYWIEFINDNEPLRDSGELEIVIREFCYDQIDQTVVADGLARNLAYAFLDRVDWRDIARHIEDAAAVA